MTQADDERHIDQVEAAVFPPDKRGLLKRAHRQEWFTLIYQLTVVVVVYFVLGSSQAMRTTWLGDILSMTPAAAWLLADRFDEKQPNDRFPYGYHRVISIAFLVGSASLLAIGVFLLYESVMKLISQTHPTIGNVSLFGYTIWMGWLMILALLYSGVPSFFLGRAKLPLAKQLHDKVLYTDASVQKADWLTALAAILGILGIGFGYWWADAAAATFISLDIVYDGFRHVKRAVFDLMDRVPELVDSEEMDPLFHEVQQALVSLPWVREAAVRLREEGHVYIGEAFVVPVDQVCSARQIREAAEKIKELDWRLADLAIMPVDTLTQEQSRDGER